VSEGDTESKEPLSASKRRKLSSFAEKKANFLNEVDAFYNVIGIDTWETKLNEKQLDGLIRRLATERQKLLEGTRVGEVNELDLVASDGKTLHSFFAHFKRGYGKKQDESTLPALMIHYKELVDVLNKKSVVPSTNFQLLGVKVYFWSNIKSGNVGSAFESLSVDTVESYYRNGALSTNNNDVMAINFVLPLCEKATIQSIKTLSADEGHSTILNC